MTKMASVELSNGRSYVRDVAVVMGIMTIVVFSVFLIVAGPGKEMLRAFGASENDPVSVLSSVYSADNVHCAFNSMSCDIVP